MANKYINFFQVNFFSTSASSDVFENHFESLLEIYYQSLSQTLTKVFKTKNLPHRKESINIRTKVWNSSCVFV